jgi:hypothetical protein
LFPRSGKLNYAFTIAFCLDPAKIKTMIGRQLVASFPPTKTEETT